MQGLADCASPQVALPREILSGTARRHVWTVRGHRDYDGPASASEPAYSRSVTVRQQTQLACVGPELLAHSPAWMPARLLALWPFHSEGFLESI
eukprot:1558352-Amphidinium_carterae.1